MKKTFEKIETPIGSTLIGSTNFMIRILVMEKMAIRSKKLTVLHFLGMPVF